MLRFIQYHEKNWHRRVRSDQHPEREIYIELQWEQEIGHMTHRTSTCWRIPQEVDKICR